MSQQQERPSGPAWWKPADFAERQAFGDPPSSSGALEPSSLPEKPWRAGEARPAAALPLSSAEAGLACAVSMMGLWLVAVGSGAAPRIDSAWKIGVLMVAMNTIHPVAMGLQTWSARRWSAKGAVLGAKVAAVETVGILSSLVGLTALIAAHGVRWLTPRKTLGGVGIEPPPNRLSVFEERVGNVAVGLRRRARILRDHTTEGLSEVGAWRCARLHVFEGNGVAAAKVWMAKPFNPSWRARLGRDAHGESSALRGQTMSFLEAIEHLAARSGPESSVFLADAAASMRAAAEQLELGDLLGARREAPTQAAKPAKRRAGL